MAFAPLRPFRFAAQAFEAKSGKEWLDIARRTEALGYSTLFTTDHYFGPGSIADSSGHRPVDVAPIAAMTSAASVTTDLRVGCRVFNVDLHHPVVLAKEMATLDLLSDGRVEVGLGAGWVAAEYEGLGVTMDRPGVRISRLGEVVGLMKAHWRGDEMAVERHVCPRQRLCRASDAGATAPSADLHRRWPRADLDAGRTAGGHRQLQLRQLRRQARVGECCFIRRCGDRTEAGVGARRRRRSVRRDRAGDRCLLRRRQRRSRRRRSRQWPAASVSARPSSRRTRMPCSARSTRSAPPSTSGANASDSRTSPSHSGTSTTSPPLSPASLEPDDRPTAMPDS